MPKRANLKNKLSLIVEKLCVEVREEKKVREQERSPYIGTELNNYKVRPGFLKLIHHKAINVCY